MRREDGQVDQVGTGFQKQFYPVVLHITADYEMLHELAKILNRGCNSFFIVREIRPDNLVAHSIYLVAYPNYY